MARAFQIGGCLALIPIALAFSAPADGQTTSGAGATDVIRVVVVQGTVECSTNNAASWSFVKTNQFLHAHDRLRTAANSRVGLRWSDQSVLSFGPSTELEILPPDSDDADSGLHLIRGVLSFFHRDKPGRIRVITRGAAAGIEGTEFVLSSVPTNNTERTTLSVIDGTVSLAGAAGKIILTNGQQAMVEAGQAPVRTSGFIVNDVLQWCFYYPAVVDPDELPLTPAEQDQLLESLSAYRNGDLLRALEGFPQNVNSPSDGVRIYHAALVLAAGNVAEAETELNSLSATNPLSRSQRLAAALHELIAAVKLEKLPASQPPELASELLARSYYEQSLNAKDSLKNALAAARSASVKSPNFGFAWERVAELEFSFGHTDRALSALKLSEILSPRNPQGLALEGFLLAAKNRSGEAIGWFNRALAVDSELGNAWLGRGLCRIHLGDEEGGREDLLIAAAIEPQRAELRSYLGKADANAGDDIRAYKEFHLAERLDPNDPTAWLYAALLNQQNNRVNEAIRDLEKSKELNGNRSVYRSQLLLDQDQAVRSANLAGMYQDAGMSDVAIREASRAVSYDYANYSAHLFLANSFNELRDPNLIDLRYENVSSSEYLIADLLAPVGAGVISPIVSQQEYSRLFEHDHLGVVSSTEYLSRGAWNEIGAQYGTIGNLNYSLSGAYRTDPGERVNQDVELKEVSLSLKQQITAKDTLSFDVERNEAEGGDGTQYYDPSFANRYVRTREVQEPLVSLGYHHEWSPGVHTLLLLARLDDTLSLTNPAEPTLIAFRPDIDPINSPGVTRLTAVNGIDTNERFVGKLDIYSGELQQVFELPSHTTVAGALVQYGHFKTYNLQWNPRPFSAEFPPPPAPAEEQDIRSLYHRFSIYGYHEWQVFEPLQLIGGLAFDHIRFPENFRTVPISSREETAEQISPKAGFIWTPTDKTTVRFAYTRSLAGPSLEQSYRLEPPVVAGFIQSFRGIIPESVVGPSGSARIETYGLSMEQQFRTGTYIGISGELLNSDVSRTIGAFDALTYEYDYAIASGLRQRLDYTEKSVLFTANQLVGRDWSFGLRYKVSHANLRQDFVDVPDGLLFYDFTPRQHWDALLHRLDLTAIFNHPSGFFAEGDAVWHGQSNSGYVPDEPGDDFWQFNAYAGYRFFHRRAEVTVGLLNITDQDYRLNPLNFYQELPRHRTILARLRVNF